MTPVYIAVFLQTMIAKHIFANTFVYLKTLSVYPVSECKHIQLLEAYFIKAAFLY